MQGFFDCQFMWMIIAIQSVHPHD